MINAKDYTLALADGRWFIGKLERHTLNDAFELQIQAQVKGGMLDVQYIAQPIGMFPDIDSIAVPGANTYAIADFDKTIQDALGRALQMGKDIRQSMIAGRSGIALATTLPRTST